MLPRSTAWRHGDGRTCTKNTSISRSRPSCTIRLAGLMSRCDSPMSHILRISCSPSSMIWSSTVGFADLDGVLEELHRDQVLALGGDLDDVERLRGREALLAEQSQGVVLVLHEASDRAEGGLVLQAAVEHRAPELVPAVRAHVVPRVELREDRPLDALVVDDPHLQRRGAAGALEPDGLHAQDLVAELLLHGELDRLAAPARHVEVRRLPLVAVLDGIDVVGRPRAEDRDGDREAEEQAEQRVGEVVDPEVDAQQRGHEHHDGTDELGVHPRSAGRHEHVRDAGDHDRETPHGERGGRIPLPGTDDRDVERPRSRREEQQPFRQQTGDRHADQEQGEVPPPPEPRHARRW